MRAIAAVIPLLLALPAGAHTNLDATAVTWEALPCPDVCSWFWDGESSGACQPFPPNYGFDDVTTVPAPGAPGKVTVLHATIDPAIDWDLYICANSRWPTELARGANVFGEPCDNALGPNTLVPVGCHEDASTAVTPGQTLILRAYNWLDIPTATGRYWFTFV